MLSVLLCKAAQTPLLHVLKFTQGVEYFSRYSVSDGNKKLQWEKCPVFY